MAVSSRARPEGVGLNQATPIGIESHGTVLVGETTTGKANVRNLDALQRGNYIVADAAGIQDCQIRPNVMTSCPRCSANWPKMLRSINGQANLLRHDDRRSCSHDDEPDKQRTQRRTFFEIVSDIGILWK